MIRALIAEALGCAMLALAALGTAQAAHAAGLPIIPAVAASAGLMLLVTITIMGPVSGGHLNPAITILMLARREVSWFRAAAYIAAQCVGAMIGAVLVAVMARTDGPNVTMTAMVPGWGLSEALATGGFVLIVAGALSARPSSAPLLAGAYGATMVLSTVSGGMANPAVMAARALLDGAGGVVPLLSIQLAGWQMIGAIVTVLPAVWLFKPQGQATP